MWQALRVTASRSHRASLRQTGRTRRAAARIGEEAMSRFALRNVAVLLAVAAVACSSDPDEGGHSGSSILGEGGDLDASSDALPDGGHELDGGSGTCVRSDPYFCPGSFPDYPQHYVCTGDVFGEELQSTIPKQCWGTTGELNPEGIRTLCCVDLGETWAF